MITYKQLPYSLSSLEPYISSQTLEYHWGKHYKGYVDKTNSILQKGKIDYSDKNLYNNSNQVWNHEFYFDQLTPSPTQIPQKLLNMIKDSFGSFEEFKTKFIEESMKIFGSGWCWLCVDELGCLVIIPTQNSDQPIIKPIMVVDVWEHAYYVDYRNARPAYLEKFFSHIHWDFVSKSLEWAKKEGLNSVNFYMNSLHA